jgi:hypothetical protein
MGHLARRQTAGRYIARLLSGRYTLDGVNWVHLSHQENGDYRTREEYR